MINYSVDGKKVSAEKYSTFKDTLIGQEDYRCIESVDEQGNPEMTTSYIATDSNGKRYQIDEKTNREGGSFRIGKLA